MVAVLTITITISACSGGAPGSKEAPAVKKSASPVFKGAVLGYSSGKGSLSLHWPVAADDTTPADKLAYKVYVGTAADPGALAQSANLKATVTNKTTATVYELTPGGTYYCLVKAVNEAGNQSLNTGVSAITVLTNDLVAVTTPKVLEKMNLTVTQSDADHAVISGAEAESVAANNIIVMNNAYGQSLKKVVTAKNSGGSVAVTLKDASLGEVVRSGNIGSATLMASINDLSAQKTGGEIPGTANMRYTDPAGFFDITEYGVSDDAGARAAKNMAKYREMISFAPGITLGYSILFEPEMTTTSQFEPGKLANTLTNIRVSAKGTLNFDGKALYELQDAASHDVTRRVLNRTISMKYAVGAVPVEQETNLEVMAHLQLNAGAPLNMYADLSTSKNVEIAFEWTRETGWRQAANDTFDQRITLNIMAEGKIVGTLELYPIISTRYFKAVKTGSYKVPKLDVNADVRIIPPPLEVSVFDSNVHVDSYIAASPKVFGFTLAEWEKNQREIQNQKLQPPTAVAMADTGKKGAVGTDVPLDLKIADKGPAKPPVVEAKLAPAPAPVAKPAPVPTPAPAPMAKPAPVPTPAPVVEAKSVAKARAAAPAAKGAEEGTTGSAMSLNELIPAVVSTNQIPTMAVLTASGGNLKNVDKVTFNLVRVKSGAKAGTYIWTKDGKLLGRSWNSKVIVNADGTLTLKPFVIGRGATSRQTTWTVTLTDQQGASVSKSFLVAFSSDTATPTVSAVKEPKQEKAVKTAHAVTTPPPAPKPAPAPKPEPVKVAPPKVAPPVEKAEAPVAPPPAPKLAPAPKPEPVKVTPPVEKAQAPVTPPPAPPPAPKPAPKPEPVKVTPPKVAPPVEKAEAPVAPPPAPKPAPAPKPEPVKVAPPVEKAKAPVAPPPAPKPAPAPKPEPVKVAPPVEKAAAPVAPSSNVSAASATGAGVGDLMGGTIQRTLSVTGAVSTFAGAANATGATDGPMAAARFNYLHGITADGKNLYITDQTSGTIRKVVIATGTVSTIAGSAGAPGSTDGTGAAAKFYLPEGITTDGTNLYVADRNNQTIRKVIIASGAVTTLAGRPGTPGSTDATGGEARFSEPNGITTDGKNLYVTDKKNNSIRKIVIATGAVSTIAGKSGIAGSADGTGAAAQFTGPAGITTDGKNLYVADQYSYTIRKIVIATGAVTTIAGKSGIAGTADGKGTAAQFTGPAGITTDGQNLYVTEPLKNTVRKVVIATGAVTTLSGSEGAAAQFKTPKGITSDGTYLYVADYGTQTVKKIK